LAPRQWKPSSKRSVWCDASKQDFRLALSSDFERFFLRDWLLGSKNASRHQVPQQEDVTSRQVYLREGVT